MKCKKSLVLLASLAFVLLDSGIGVTRSSFVDLESSIGNNFQAWAATQWVQTTQAHFNAGVFNEDEIDISSSSGNVTLAIKSDWYDSDWLYRRQITIDHTKVDDVADPSTTYADFPVLVYATGLSNILAGGADVRFTSSDGVTELPREIESYSGGTLYAWVKLTLTKDVSDSADDVIYMYYGNASASEPPAGSPYGSQNVWDSKFVMVQHMKDDPDTSHIADSTSNNNNGTKKGANEPNEVSGDIDKAQDFDGSEDYIELPASDSILTDSPFTISAWINTDTQQGAYGSEGRIVNVHRVDVPSWSTGAAIYAGGYSGYSQNSIFFLFCTTDAGNHYWLGYETLDPYYYDGTGHLISATHNGTTAILYYDGEQVATVDRTYGTFGTSPAQIGTYDKAARFFEGAIDEVRVSDTVRSAEWIKTGYTNQDSPSSFCNVESEEGQYVSSGTIASQVRDTGVAGATWVALFWDETLESNTDITFEARASDTIFDKGDGTPSWTDFGTADSPITSGLPSGQYMQWRATLITSDDSKIPTLEEVRLYHY